jgi:hypothetical protein
MTKNAAFPNPPLTAIDLGKLAVGFHEALKESLQGGLKATAIKTHAREALLSALQQEASYVEALSGQRTDTLLSSGFYAVTFSRRNAGPLSKPLPELLTDVGSMCLRVKLARVPNARSYQVQYCTNVSGAWQEAGVYAGTRRIVLNQLAPGTTNTVSVRAIGGSTGQSDWSNPVSQMAV